MRFPFALSIALVVTTVASIGAHAAPAALDMCAIDASGYSGDIYDNGWLADLPAKRSAGTVLCERQSMHLLGSAKGRIYVYWDVTFSEQDPSYEPPRRPHVVAQIGEYDTDGKLTIVHRISQEREPSELAASLVERDGVVMIAITDPGTRVLVRGATGFESLSLGTSLYGLPTKLVDASMPPGYLPPMLRGEEQEGYDATFNIDAFAMDLPVAVASEVFPRPYADPEYDRPLTLRFPLHLKGEELTTGEPELIALEAGSSGIGETPAIVSIPKAVRACRLSAYLQDDDPAGVTVRATADAKGLAIATLPSARMTVDGDYTMGAEVEIVGSIDGWFLIEDARHPAELYGEAGSANPGTGSDLVRKAYRGRGWVHGSRLSAEIQSGQSLRASADPASKAVFDLKLDDTGESYATITGFKSCVGEAVEVSVKRSGDGVEGAGWIGGDDQSRLCSNQATTCN